MRPALLLAAAGLFAAAGGAAVVSHTSTAAIAAAEADGVHATTEADLAQLRAARPTLDGTVLVGLRLRWCVSEGRCR